ncbi:hypothetical protein ACH5RR_011126 [Cinchona calisaya]|uniref:Uncharacterized protein n=1 Tax=Cinchona calisaya TaxID=153742 RepID=A0ABD3A7I4_9GENT
MEEKKKQGQLQAIWFAAGTAAFMACLQRAVLASFVEQWRVVVFLSLNLLLLAILFTSPPPLSPLASSNEPTVQDLNENMEFEIEGTKKRRKQGSSTTTAADDHPEDVTNDRWKLLKCRSKRQNQNGVQNLNEATVKNQANYELSKEELNERVEAFIAMFRQHLVSDAKGKSCRVQYSSSIKRRTVYNSTDSGGMRKRF